MDEEIEGGLDPVAVLPGIWRVYGRSVAFLMVPLFGVGIAGHACPATEPFMRLLTPGFILLTAGLALAPSLAAGGIRFGIWLAGTYVFTFALEAIGVATGRIFGTYEYGPTLGLAWRGVPLIIAFNWAMVVNGATRLAARLVPPAAGGWRRPAIAGLAGGIALAFDFVLEPVAIRLDYWRWPGDVVPLQNYAAWFAIAAAAAAAHPGGSGRCRELGSHGRLAVFFVLAQAAFFLALSMVWRFGAG